MTTRRFAPLCLSLLTSAALLMSAGCGAGFKDPLSALTGTEDEDAPVCRSQYTPNYADNLEDFLRWKDLPVSVRFATKFTLGDRELEDQLRAGFNKWTRATSGAVRWTETSSSDANLVVTMEKLDAAPGGGDTLGRTRVRWNAGENRIRSATMVVYVWDRMSESEVNRLVNTGAHEFGHALGLMGHSPYDDDVMVPAGNKGAISERDFNTLASAYCGFSRSRSRPESSPAPAAPSRTTTVEAAAPADAEGMRSVEFRCPTF